MNPPHRSSSVHRSAVPGYRKWYFGAGGSPGRRGMEAAPEPDPLPFEEIHEHAEITVGPPSTSADGYSAHGTFTIPEGAEGKKLYGTCSLFLGVDDWGILEVKDSGGNVVAQVDLKENPQTAGEQGGHKYHTGTGGAGKNPNRVPARETRATTAAERRLPRRWPGRALRRAWKAAPWETTARRGAA